MEKNKGGEPLFGLFSRPERGAKGLLAWLWCAGWLSGGGCGFVLVVQVGVGFGVSPFCPAPLVPRCPGGGRAPLLPCTSPFWALEKSPINFSLGPWSGSATHVTSTGHFSHRLFGWGGFLPRPLSHRLFRGGGRLPRPHSHPHSHCHTTFATDLGPQEFWPIVTKVTIFTLGVPIFHPG